MAVLAKLSGIGPADVVLEGTVNGPIVGSLVVDDSHQSITFIRSGGPLLPDTYTVRLRGAANGFTSQDGLVLLDGDHDGDVGDDYISRFNIEPPPPGTITLSLPDFARGPGQEVVVPADTGSGIPLTLGDGAGVRSVLVQINYDPERLEVTGATAGPQLPAGSALTVDTSVSGTAILELTSPSDLAPGIQPLGYLLASVPSGNANEIYGTQQIVSLSDVTIRDSSGTLLPVVADNALHLVSYFGDVSGNRRINAADASQVARFAALLERGFSASLLTDPMLIGDISGNRRINAADASRVARFAALIDVPEIPPLPTGVQAAGQTDFGSQVPGFPTQLVVALGGWVAEGPNETTTNTVENKRVDPHRSAVDTVMSTRDSEVDAVTDERLRLQLEEAVADLFESTRIH